MLSVNDEISGVSAASSAGKRGALAPPSGGQTESPSMSCSVSTATSGIEAMIERQDDQARHRSLAPSASCQLRPVSSWEGHVHQTCETIAWRPIVSLASDFSSLSKRRRAWPASWALAFCARSGGEVAAPRPKSGALSLSAAGRVRTWIGRSLT
jgi:hypothetical protein